MPGQAWAWTWAVVGGEESVAPERQPATTLSIAGEAGTKPALTEVSRVSAQCQLGGPSQI